MMCVGNTLKSTFKFSVCVCVCVCVCVLGGRGEGGTLSGLPKGVGLYLDVQPCLSTLQYRLCH